MESTFFVIATGKNGEFASLFGPATFSTCKKKLLSLLKQNKVQVDEDMLAEIDLNASHLYENGGGVFIVESQSI